MTSADCRIDIDPGQYPCRCAGSISLRREVNLPDILQGPSAAHLLGADHLGRDLLSRLIHGARISLFVGFAATTLNVVVAGLIGGTSGFLGGKLDLVVQRFVDAWMSFPGLLLLLTVMSMTGRGIRAAHRGAGHRRRHPRLTRGARGCHRSKRECLLSGRRSDRLLDVEDAGPPRAAQHVAAPIIVIFSINIGAVIITEASLSFLGFGLPLQVPSWGGMLSREGRQYMEMAPRLALWPGLCLTIVVYSLNMFGDAVRDLLDPRLRGGQGSYGGR